MLLVFGLAIASFVHAHDDDVCDGVTNKELLTCTGNGYQEADKILNETYKMLIARLNVDKVSQLKLAQRKWISFKEKFCKSIYNETYPGKEAAIERNGCLWKLTKNRTIELTRIHNAAVGKGDDDYLSEALNVLEAKGHDKEIMRESYKSMYSDEKDWMSYTNASCDFTEKLLNEDRDTCLIRLNCARSYY
ncbi:MAG: lysozyme inhibitor LprI family protein [Azoarcus sp.]|jgi:uncharacterized protein YecT (DUF1311 family)|nr:lysozyme inhibitor LprI family protein [Azoarcus sp.]